MRPSLFALATLALCCYPQDQPSKPALPKPQPPADAAPLPQIPDVPMTEVARKDIWQRFSPPSPIAGVYRLRAAARGGQVVHAGVQGYLFVGDRILSLQIQDETERPGQPALQSSVREYQLDGTRLQTRSLIGARVPSGESPVLDGVGLVEVRQIERTNTTMRIVRGAGDYLEFERIE